MGGNTGPGGLTEGAKGNAVADVRRKFGITQEQLARYMGVTAKTVHNWERGKGKYGPPATVRKILERLLETKEKINF